MTKLFTRLALLCSVVVTSSQSYAIADLNTYAEGTWAVSARAGIAPTVFSKKGEFSLLAIDDSGVLASSPKSFTFTDLYRLPFTTGLDVGYFISDNWELFANFNYTQACKKKFSFDVTVDDNDADDVFDDAATVTWHIRDMNSFGFYLGSRYYLAEWTMGDFLPFVGAKLGFKNRGNCGGNEKVHVFITEDDGTVTNLRAIRDGSKDCTSFTGAFQWGFDWMFDDNYALTFMSELVGTSRRAFKSGNQFIATDGDDTLVSNVTKNPRGTLSFPVTLGIRVRM